MAAESSGVDLRAPSRSAALQHAPPCFAQPSSAASQHPIHTVQPLRHAAHEPVLASLLDRLPCPSPVWVTDTKAAQFDAPWRSGQRSRVRQPARKIRRAQRIVAAEVADRRRLTRLCSRGADQALWRQTAASGAEQGKGERRQERAEQRCERGRRAGEGTHARCSQEVAPSRYERRSMASIAEPTGPRPLSATAQVRSILVAGESIFEDVPV